MPTSLMGPLCSLFGQFGDKIKGFNEHLASKFVGEQGRGFVGRCPLHLWSLYVEFSTISSKFKGHQINYHKGSQASKVGLLLIASFGQPSP